MDSGLDLDRSDLPYIILFVLLVTIEMATNWWVMYFPTPIWGALFTALIALVALFLVLIERLGSYDGDYESGYGFGFGEGFHKGFQVGYRVGLASRSSSNDGSQPDRDEADDRNDEDEDEDGDAGVEEEYDTERS